MPMLREKGDEPRYVDDFPLKSQASVTVEQVPIDSRNVSRTASASSGVSEMETPFYTRKTPGVGKEHVSKIFPLSLTKSFSSLSCQIINL